jgi:hypothetical protein
VSDRIDRATVYDLAATIARYESALRFYADNQRYHLSAPFNDLLDPGRDILRDHGRLARIALGEEQPETTIPRKSVS